jgi:hypothetical protein
MTKIGSRRNVRQHRELGCPHVPRCPGDRARDRSGARTIASHPEQGWSLLCNGVVAFDDGGALLPGAIPLPPSFPPANASLRVAARSSGRQRGRSRS